MVETFVSVRNGKFKIELFCRGTGEPLVFLHSAGGLAAWPPFLDLLAQHYRVYAPLLPGYQKSEGLENLDDVIDLALYHLDLFDALGLQTPSLIGHSFGGMIAAEVAALNPQRVKRLVLMAPVGLWIDSVPVLDFFVMPPEELVTALWHNPESPAAQQMLIVPESAEAQMEAMVERTKALTATGKFLWPIPEKGLKKRIHRITAPTLLLWGMSDQLVPPVYGEEFCRLIPGARLTLLTECSHMLPFEKPEESARLILDFLREGL